MNWLKNLFASKKVEQLKEEIEELKAEVDKRQDAINKTNAFWKKKMHELSRKQTSQK